MVAYEIYGLPGQLPISGARADRTRLIHDGQERLSGDRI